MGKWKQLIVEGNQLFEQKCFMDAFDLYQKAKERAHVLFEVWPNANEATVALVVSYHNIAELHLENGHKNLEYSELQEVLDFLSTELEKYGDDEPRCLAVLNGISKSETQLMRFLSQHRMYQETKQLLRDQH